MFTEKYVPNKEFLKNLGVLTKRNNENLQSHKDLLQKYIKDLDLPIELNASNVKDNSFTNNLNLTLNQTLENQNFNLKTDQTRDDISINNKNHKFDEFLSTKSKKNTDFLQFDHNEMIPDLQNESNIKCEPVLFSNIDSLIDRVKKKHANWALLEGQLNHGYNDDVPAIQIDMSAKKAYESGDTDAFLNKLKNRLFKVENNEKTEKEDMDSHIVRRAEKEINEIKNLAKKIERNLLPEAENKLEYDKTPLTELKLIDKNESSSNIINESSSKYFLRECLTSQPNEFKRDDKINKGNKLEKVNLDENSLILPKSKLNDNINKKSKLSELQMIKNKENEANQKSKEASNKFLSGFKQKMAGLKKNYNNVTTEKNEQCRQIVKVKSPLRPTKNKFQHTIKNNQKINSSFENDFRDEYSDSDKKIILDVKNLSFKKIVNQTYTSSQGDEAGPEYFDVAKNLDSKISPILIENHDDSPDQQLRLPGQITHSIRSSYNVSEFMTPMKRNDGDKASELSYSQSNNSLLLTDLKSKELERSQRIEIELDFNKSKIEKESNIIAIWNKKTEEEFDRFCENDDDINKLKSMIFYHQNEIEKLNLQLH